MIKVEEMRMQLSEPNGAWDDFYNISEVKNLHGT